MKHLNENIKQPTWAGRNTRFALVALATAGVAGVGRLFFLVFGITLYDPPMFVVLWSWLVGLFVIGFGSTLLYTIYAFSMWLWSGIPPLSENIPDREDSKTGNITVR